MLNFLDNKFQSLCDKTNDKPLMACLSALLFGAAMFVMYNDHYFPGNRGVQNLGYMVLMPGVFMALTFLSRLMMCNVDRNFTSYLTISGFLGVGGWFSFGSLTLGPAIALTSLWAVVSIALHLGLEKPFAKRGGYLANHFSTKVVKDYIGLEIVSGVSIHPFSFVWAMATVAVYQVVNTQYACESIYAFLGIQAGVFAISFVKTMCSKEMRELIAKDIQAVEDAEVLAKAEAKANVEASQEELGFDIAPSHKKELEAKASKDWETKTSHPEMLAEARAALEEKQSAKSA